MRLTIYKIPGPGVCAKGLGDYFSHVFVSDPGKGNLAAARQRLMPTEKFTFCQQPGEIPWLRDSSIDLSAICIALHFMDAEIVLRNVARALRPGGTLAIVSYGTAINFLDEPRLNMLSAHVMHSGIKERVDGHAGAVEMMAIRRYMAGLDSTAIPGDLFTNVLRLQINMRESVTTSFRMVPEGVLDALESEIKVGETVRYIDDDGWHDETDVAWLKGYLKSIVEFEDEAWDSAEWQEIERVITEELGGKVHIEWPVSMILALKSIATPGNS